MLWNDARVQLVDLPPITLDVMEPWLPGLVRAADAALLVVDLDVDDVADAAEAVLARLAGAHAPLVAALPHDQDDETVIPVRTALIANKADAPGASGRLDVLREWFGDRFPVLEVSATTGTGLDQLRPLAYHLLGVMRIYTKVPGKSVDRTHPFTIPIGGTVLDLAREVHHDFEHALKFARVWGAGVFEGQTVKRDHELHDMDIVELHV
jgi:ribosome-interacting GTPase 1